MNVRRLAVMYFRGWLFIIKSLLWILVWQGIILLPLVGLGLIFPEQMEGKVDGALRVRLITLICLCVWAPMAAARVGPLEPTGWHAPTTGKPATDTFEDEPRGAGSAQ